MPRGVRVADEVRLRAMELIAEGRSAWAAARELGVSHTAVGRWAREAGVGLAMGAVGGSALAAARRRRAVFEAWAAGAGRAGGVSIRTAGRWLHDTCMSTAVRPVAAVESAHGGEVLRRGRRGGAVRPSDHRGPDARVSGRVGRGLRLGAGERAMIATGLAQGDLGRPHRPPDRPVPADRVPRDPPRGRRGAGSTAGRRRRPRPGRGWPAPRSASRRRPGPARAGRRPARGIGSVPGRSPPVCGSRTPMMRACASVTSRSTQGPGCVQGAGSLRAQLRVEKALRTGRTRRTPALPTGRRSPSPGARAGYRGATISLRPPQADEGAVPGHWEADLIIAGRPPAAP